MVRRGGSDTDRTLVATRTGARGSGTTTQAAPAARWLPPDTETPGQTVLAFDDNRLASLLFGNYGQNLATIERRLDIVAEQRGNHVTL